MMSGAQTAALVDAALEGDERAFTRLVETHLKAVYLTALAVVGRPSDAEDVAQTSFARAFEKLHTCGDTARFSGWLLQITRNCALSLLKQRRFREPAGQVAEGAVGEPTPSDPFLRDELLRALARLTATQRQVVLLHDVEQWSHSEIGEELEMSEVSSRQHLFLARQALRSLLSELGTREVEHGH